MHSSPAIADGKVYVGSYDGNLYAFGEICDVSITSITTSKTVVGQGYTVDIIVTAANQGNYTENFSVTVYANTTEIGTREIALSSENPMTITFT